VSWLDRQSFLGADSDEILAGSTVGIVGLGGGGSHIAQQLVHLGIGKFVLVDPDKLEDTNLNRLVGGRYSDIAAATEKVEIARRLIKGIAPTAEIVVRTCPWQEAIEDLKSCDIIVGGLDSVRAKDELDAFCRRLLIPYIDIGMDVHALDCGEFLISGQVVLSSPGTPCLRCLKIVTEQALEREGAAYGAAGGRPQVIWPNGLLASTAVGLVVQSLTPWHGKPVDGAYLSYDGNLGVVSENHRLRAAQKLGCSHYLPDERGDPLFDVRRLGAEVAPEHSASSGWLMRLWRWAAETIVKINRAKGD
jgi:molybdopterin-synthase adenylyltransferase